jgi:hypothetical protein
MHGEAADMRKNSKNDTFTSCREKKKNLHAREVSGSIPGQGFRGVVLLVPSRAI